jgi:formylglycine-generating enzyme required for sulfatase activity
VGGKTVTGRLTAGTFNLRTAYGDLELSNHWVLDLQLVGLPAGLAQLLTTSSNRMTGFVQTETFLIATNSETEAVRYNRWQIERISQKQGSPEEDSPSVWVRLRSGDILRGAFKTEGVALQTDTGIEQVALSDVLGWAWARVEHEAEVILREGKRIRGTLMSGELILELSCGPAVNLPTAEIAFLGQQINDVQSGRIAVGPIAGITNHFPGLVWIPPGEFIMGSAPEEIGRDSDEGPQTRVVIRDGFYLGKHEVTQGEYQALMGVNPSINAGNPLRPVEKLSWYEAMEFCERLTTQAERDGTLPEGWQFRLPTEAEWEYACRAGTTTRFSYGDDKTELQLGDFGWFTRNSDSMTHPVGLKQPNAWGLYDLHGNVWEWCLDRWGGLLPGSSVTNAPAAARGTLRAARGGSWLYEARSCRSANRDDYSAANKCGDLGMRVVLAKTH